MKRILIPLAPLAACFAAATLTSAQPAPPAPAPDADPFSADPAAPRPAAAAAGKRTGDLSICYESFSLDLASAATIARVDRSDSDLYDLLVKLVADGKARQECLAVVRTRSGQRATCESIAEYIYPTEWEPAQLSNSIGIKIDSSDSAKDGAAATDADPLQPEPNPPANKPVSLATPATATSFHTRNLGLTLEVEPLTDAEGSTIEQHLSLQHLTLIGTTSYGQGVSQLETPRFETQQVSMGIRSEAGVPRLLGTINRPPVSQVDPDSAQRIFLAFLTVTHVQN